MTNDELIKHLAALTKPSKQQLLLLQLAAVSERKKDDEKKLGALLRAEQATIKAAQARSKITALLRNEEKAKAVEERKARNHRLILQGVLVDLAGLAGKSRGEILGALFEISTVTNPEKWQEWKQAGDAELSKEKWTVENYI